MKRRRGGIVAGVLGLALATGGLRAWVPLVGELWPDGPVAITLDLAGTAPAGSTGDWEAAAREAMAAWNSRLQRVQLTEAPRREAAWYENGRSELFFDRAMFDEPFPSGVLAVTGATYDRGVRVETDIVFNANVRWSVYPGRIVINAADLRRVAVHELGHLLGLGHPDEAGQTVSAVMNSRVGDVEVPTADDDRGARALYDQGAGGAPVVVTQPVAASVVQGAPVKLSVGAGGRGPLAYEWRRDGVPVAGGTAATLRFTAGLADAGAYAVTVRNAAGGTTSNSAAVTVRAAAAPLVSADLSSSPIAAGGDLMLSSSVSRGDAPMTFEWRRNGVAIPGATQPKLVLRDIQFSDAGDYAVTATNAAGSATSTARQVIVTPGQPPRFTGEPASTALAPGATVVLSAASTASGPVTYQWQKNGADVAGATGATLQLANFRAAEAGSYALTITNAFGRVTSRAAEITALESTPWSITRQPAGVAVSPGGTATLVVETDAVGASYRWFKDGAPLTAAQLARVTGGATGTLTVPNVDPRDVGAYSAEVSAGGVVMRSQPARLILQSSGELVIARQPSHHTVPLGYGVQLAVGAPQAAGQTLSYQWFKDDQASAGRTGSTLAFTATAGDAGRYRVRVTAGASSVDSETVEVAIVPETRFIFEHPPSQLITAANSEEARLQAVAAEVAFRRAQRTYAVYYYSRNGERITGYPHVQGSEGSGSYTLTIGDGTRTETSRPFTLDYFSQGGPVILEQPRGGSVWLGDAVRLRVVASVTIGVTYQWLRDGTILSGGQAGELIISAFAERDRGSYTVRLSHPQGIVTSEPALLEIRGSSPPIIVRHPTGVVAVAGDLVTLAVSARPGEFRYQWLKEGVPVAGANGATLTFAATAATTGNYAVAVTDGSVSATSRVAPVSVLAASRPPEIRFQPVDTTVPLGGDATLAVGADGAPLPDRYQWRKDGVALPGETGAKLKLRGVTAEAAGVYTVVVSSSLATVISAPARVVVDAAGRLVNLATRAAVGRGGDILIAGFVIRGTEPRPVLLRGIGDQLSEFGVTGVLRDPVLSVFDAQGKQLARNDDWFRTGDEAMAALQGAARQVGAFAQREDARDGALLLTLAPGSYTAQVAGLGGTTGVALVEIYDLGRPAAERLINLSSRAVVGSGANILIPGLVLDGAAPRRVLIRAVGPGLAELGVAGVLADPVMRLFRGAEEVARNDNWGEQPDAARLAPAMAAVGAFPLRAGSRDAVLLVELPPGNYTVQVAGVGEMTGIALVEVYELPAAGGGVP